MKRFLTMAALTALLANVAVADEYLGNLSDNPYNANSTSNPYGRYGSPHSSDSINNPYGAGSRYKSDSPNNPYGKGLEIYGE